MVCNSDNTPAVRFCLSTLKYKLWDEITATSLSGQHLEHILYFFEPFKFKDDRDQVYIKEKREANCTITPYILLVMANSDDNDS